MAVASVLSDSIQFLSETLSEPDIITGLMMAGLVQTPPEVLTLTMTEKAARLTRGQCKREASAKWLPTADTGSANLHQPGSAQRLFILITGRNVKNKQILADLLYSSFDWAD